MWRRKFYVCAFEELSWRSRRVDGSFFLLWCLGESWCRLCFLVTFPIAELDDIHVSMHIKERKKHVREFTTILDPVIIFSGRDVWWSLTGVVCDVWVVGFLRCVVFRWVGEWVWLYLSVSALCGSLLEELSSVFSPFLCACVNLIHQTFPDHSG